MKTFKLNFEQVAAFISPERSPDTHVITVTKDGSIYTWNLAEGVIIYAKPLASSDLDWSKVLTIAIKSMTLRALEARLVQIAHQPALMEETECGNLEKGHCKKCEVCRIRPYRYKVNKKT